MARPEEPLNRENLSLILGLYQSIVEENPRAWVKGKTRAPKARSIWGAQTGRSSRRGRGRITREVAGYKITIHCDLTMENNKGVTLIRMSAPGWSVNLRGVPFVGGVGEIEYRITRVGDSFVTGMHFVSATCQGLERFKHQMTLISMFADVTPLSPSRWTQVGDAW